MSFYLPKFLNGPIRSAANQNLSASNATEKIIQSIEELFKIPTIVITLQMIAYTCSIIISALSIIRIVSWLLKFLITTTTFLIDFFIETITNNNKKRKKNIYTTITIALMYAAYEFFAFLLQKIWPTLSYDKYNRYYYILQDQPVNLAPIIIFTSSIIAYNLFNYLYKQYFVSINQEKLQTNSQEYEYLLKRGLLNNLMQINKQDEAIENALALLLSNSINQEALEKLEQYTPEESLTQEQKRIIHQNSKFVKRYL